MMLWHPSADCCSSREVARTQLRVGTPTLAHKALAPVPAAGAGERRAVHTRGQNCQDRACKHTLSLAGQHAQCVRPRALHRLPGHLQRRLPASQPAGTPQGAKGCALEGTLDSMLASPESSSAWRQYLGTGQQTACLRLQRRPCGSLPPKKGLHQCAKCLSCTGVWEIPLLSWQPRLSFEIIASFPISCWTARCRQPNHTALRHGLCCLVQVFHQDVLASLLAPDSAQYAVRTAHEVFTAYQQSHMSLPDIFQEHDALGLSEGMAGAHA